MTPTSSSAAGPAHGPATGAAAPGDAVPPALQTERTRLAWRRMTLAATVVAVLAGSHVLVNGASPLAMVSLAMIGFAWLGLLATAHRRIAALAADSYTGAGRSPALVAACTAGLALLGCLLTLA